ncbi:replication-associated protein [Ctenophore-associated circular genome 2]|uniref:ATP-dependent helicase Rep n=2 Tax=Ctenophore-associated circular genome 1 TaxID=1778570 RepID=A0A141MJB3_9VIRU|nr:replication-associated protein [Ctenophore-associated circular genome 1]ALY05864.1 replication-associated protein [Ctenophore-associated circular genome 1]ALY05865.1 replication-associated protein [Ctenophore-associated circular genome 2]
MPKLSDNRVVNYVFTWNNYTDDVKAFIGNFANDYCKWLVYGEEVGASGTPHLQGCFSLYDKKRITQLCKLGFKAHLEPMKGSPKQAIAYCKKDGSFTELGDVTRGQGERNDLKRACELIKEGKSISEVADACPTTYVKYSRGLRELALVASEAYEHESVRGVWIYGQTGVGKSHLARDVYPNLFDKSQSKWWDGYCNEHTVLIDDLDTDCLGHYLKRWADKYACTGETKGGTIKLQHRVFVVTSNYLPWELHKDDLMAEAISRRFTIYHKETRDQKLEDCEVLTYADRHNII